MITEYYKILGLREGCSSDDLKRAFRSKARLYHPDINHSPGAADSFIRVNEAYLFLLKYINRNSRENHEEYLREWDRIRRERARARARDYSRIRYAEFKKREIYRNARVFDGTIAIYGVLISLAIMFISIYGYTILKKAAAETGDQPSFAFMIALSFTGLVFLFISLSFLILSIRNYKTGK